MSRKVCIGLFICLFALSVCAFAQESTGGVQGTVKDAQSAVIPGAQVEIASPALIGKKFATTDSGGTYRIEGLPPGLYTVSISAPGFAPQTQNNLRIATGALPTLNFTLSVGGVSTSVEVSAEAEIIDVSLSKVQTNVTAEMLKSIPMGRSFQSVIPFAPGARQEPLQGGTGSRNNGFQIDGASDSENVYMIDGVNTTNIQTGGVGKNFQSDFIQEVQIKSSSFEAEYGGALGGVINAVPKRGSNIWTGELKTYFQSAALDANDACASGFTSAAGGSTVCGLRLNPATALNTTTRLDGTPEYFVPQKDSRHVIEPGFDIGGPIYRDRLWLFSSYIPTLDTTQRTTLFKCPSSNPTCTYAGPRRLTQNYTQHNMYDRLDYRVTDQLRLAASWNFGYSRTMGQLGAPDSAYGQTNTGATTDPTTFRPDAGTVNPLSVYSFSGDWSATPKMLVSARYGDFFNNTSTRGAPTGIRYLYGSVLNTASRDVNNNPFPANAPFNNSGFANMPSNVQTLFDAYKRRSFNGDWSYFVGNLGGSHNFKIGYAWQAQQNDVLRTANTSIVSLTWGQKYTPVTSTTACAGIQASNAAGLCQGQYGYFTVGTVVSNTGGTKATDQAFYVQDAWTVGNTGLTLNLGLRLDEEKNPAYDPNRFPSVTFGWGDKIAPRLGGAYDALHNGKLKIYGSYGKFFDIMKLGLARGSFGSDYWHDCVYALDTLDYTTITPTLTTGAGCPATGSAPGVSARFIENVDFRATKADTRDPAVQQDMKPVESHEFVAGADWALSSNWSFETRFSRKILDRTIEDMAITDNLGFYIGNPGSSFADILHRPTVIPDASGNNYLNTTAFCAECPAVNPAIRTYNGVEFRLHRRPGGKWYGSMSYTYSRLRGNYAGLTNTDPTDGGGGRHAPNNGRAFDLPTMTYLPSGKADNGPLATDRPNTVKLYGYYNLPWLGQSTSLGLSQTIYQGTPLSTCLPVVGSSSACQWAEGRGNFVDLTRDSSGNIVKGDVQMNKRSPMYTQTDLNIRHEIRVSSSNENLKLALEGTITNLLNQHNPVGYYEFAIPTNLISPSRPVRFSGDPGVDWAKVMNGYNYIDALNATGAFAGASKLTLASRYGMPQIFQTARQIRLAVRFRF